MGTNHEKKKKKKFPKYFKKKKPPPPKKKIQGYIQQHPTASSSFLNELNVEKKKPKKKSKNKIESMRMIPPCPVTNFQVYIQQHLAASLTNPSHEADVNTADDPRHPSPPLPPTPFLRGRHPAASSSIFDDQKPEKKIKIEFHTTSRPLPPPLPQ